MRTYLINAIFLFVLQGCGSLKVKDKNDQAVKKVKSAALVGFDVFQPTSSKVGLNILNGGQPSVNNSSSMLSKNSNHVDEMYNSLLSIFQKKQKWKLVDLNSMKYNTGYINSYNSTMKGWQNKMPVPAGNAKYVVNNVMDWDSLRILGPKKRNLLMQELKVDALIVGRVEVNLEGTTVMGIGNRYPKARFNFQVYSKDQDNPIWFDGGIEGDLIKESVGKTSFIDEGKIDELSLKSAKTAFSKI